MTALDVPPRDPADGEGASADGAAAASGGTRVITGPAPPLPSGLTHQPALDGLRGLAVAGVLLFHGGVPWAQGGFLGVSTFFTLSGFLITTLLLTERERSDHIDLKRFWGRRFRRLMPAALACLFGVCLFAVTVATTAQLQGLRGDALSALFYVANWHFIVVDKSYGDLFTDPSPVQHFWSLAIEEQFYVVFPLLAFFVLARAKASRAVFGAILLGLTVGSVALTIALHHPGLDPARVYYGTDTRAAELLIGALLAVLLSGKVELPKGWPRHVSAAAGAIALALCLFWWATVDQRTGWLFEGGLAVYAVCTAAIILAAVNATPVRAVLSITGLRLLGKISYGVYLYHWPIFLWLSPRATGLSLWPLFALRLSVTLAVAVLSYHLLEWPVRERRWPRGPNRMLVAPAAVLLLVVAILGVTWDPPPPELDFEGGETPATVPIEADVDSAGATDPLAVERVLLMGDSVMQQAFGAIERPLQREGVQVGYAGGPGSGPLFPQGDWSSQLSDWLTEFQPDVVVMEACCDYTDFADELYVDAEGNEVLPGTDEMFVAWDQEVQALIAQVEATGAPILFVQPAPVQTNGFYGPIEQQVSRLREVYADYGDLEGVSLLDWGEILAPDGDFTWDVDVDGESVKVRADDGVHNTEVGNALLSRATVDAIFSEGRHPPGESPTSSTTTTAAPG
jgi:peptidoglycan/LPS O-acetylase OafA/YrhL